MRRSLRFLGRYLIIFSLLLFFISIIFWIRSYWAANGITYSRNGYDANGQLIRDFTSLTSSRGHIQISRGQILSLAFRAFAARYQEGLQFTSDKPTDLSFRSSSSKIWSHLGVAYAQMASPVLTSSGLAIPYWLLSLLLVLPSSIWLLWWCMGTDFASHQCPTCGYDLRATPDLCPECGTVPCPPASRPSLPSLLARKAALAKNEDVAHSPRP